MRHRWVRQCGTGGCGNAAQVGAAMRHVRWGRAKVVQLRIRGTAAATRLGEAWTGQPLAADVPPRMSQLGLVARFVRPPFRFHEHPGRVGEPPASRGKRRSSATTRCPLRVSLPLAWSRSFLLVLWCSPWVLLRCSTSRGSPAPSAATAWSSASVEDGAPERRSRPPRPVSGERWHR